MRTRHLARFTELEDERAQIDAQLAALAKTTHDTPDPSLLDRLPMLGDLITEAPIRLQRRLYEAFDLQLLYNKHLHQVTIWATITPTTPGTLAAIINDSDDGHPAASNPPAGAATGTSHPEFSDPLPTPRWRKSSMITKDPGQIGPRILRDHGIGRVFGAGQAGSQRHPSLFSQMMDLPSPATPLAPWSEFRQNSPGS